MRGRNEGDKGAQFPGHRITVAGAEKSQQCTSAFFNTVNLLPKDLGFEHGGAKLVFCPERHLTSLRPCMYAKQYIHSHHTLKQVSRR